MCIPNSLGRIHTESEREREVKEWMDAWKAYWILVIGWVKVEENLEIGFWGYDGNGRKDVNLGKGGRSISLSIF